MEIMLTEMLEFKRRKVKAISTYRRYKNTISRVKEYGDTDLMNYDLLSAGTPQARARSIRELNKFLNGFIKYLGAEGYASSTQRTMMSSHIIPALHLAQEEYGLTLKWGKLDYPSTHFEPLILPPDALDAILKSDHDYSTYFRFQFFSAMRYCDLNCEPDEFYLESTTEGAIPILRKLDQKTGRAATRVLPLSVWSSARELAGKEIPSQHKYNDALREVIRGWNEYYSVVRTINTPNGVSTKKLQMWSIVSSHVLRNSGLNFLRRSGMSREITEAQGGYAKGSNALSKFYFGMNHLDWTHVLRAQESFAKGL